jgi:3-isopropylmalate/(R)-2-methylmalate dehydratase large subunit
MVLKMIGLIGTAGGTGYVIEYCGSAIRALSMEGAHDHLQHEHRGRRAAGLIAPDETTFQYVTSGDRPYAPKGAALERAMAYGGRCPPTRRRTFDRELTIDCEQDCPAGHLGHQPRHGDRCGRQGARIPTCARLQPRDVEQALDYMGLKAGTPITDIRPDTIFIGSCTNARIEDLRKVAAIIKGRKKASSRAVMVVPGSMAGARRPRPRGWTAIFTGFRRRVAARRVQHVPGHEPRPAQAGRALRLHLEPQLRGASGQGRSHPSGQPEMAAAAAIEGHFVDIRSWK